MVFYFIYVLDNFPISLELGLWTFIFHPLLKGEDRR